jgi:hypothetical protein
MRRAIMAVCGSLMMAWSVVAVASDQPAATAKSNSDAPLVVHEWGTFTNFSGSDGVQLEFRPLVERDLPGFVRNCWDPSGLGLLLGKSSIGAFQRMETPVTYFYTPVERDVQVRVRFPQGLLTEFFPPVVAVTPAETNRSQLNDAASPDLKDGGLDWGTVHLIPIESLSTHVADRVLAKSMGHFVAEQILPAAVQHPHYVHARATDAALVHVRVDADHQDRGKGDYFEKFLFYRGLGNFKLPLTLAAHGKGAYELTNRGPDAVRSLFLVTIQGNDLRYTSYERIGGNSTLTMTDTQQLSTVEQLTEEMAQALTREGLYRKEADAMVNSWRDSWFAEEGTRLLYMVPQKTTNELLPLEISPQPNEMVRVLVGRMEIMSPEDEGRILSLVERSAGAREAEQRATDGGASQQDNGGRTERRAVLDEVLAMGRLAEPALARASRVATETALRTEAMQLISDVREHHRLQGQ